MAADDTASPRPPGTASGPRSTLRAVALPAEHGGWGLTLEPVLLGLLVAPSVAGLAIGVAGLLAFVARTPLKLAAVDRRRHRSLARTRVARRLAAVELMAAALALALAVASASGPFWWPLVAAVPCAGVELWFDVRSRGRRLVPELAGAIGIGSLAAAIVVAAGAPGVVAAGAWAVVAARAVASVPFARHQVRRLKGQPTRRAGADAAQVAAAVVAGIAWTLGWLPLLAVGAVVGLGVVQAALGRRPVPSRAAVIGLQQLGFGLAVVVVAAVALR